MNPKLNTSAIDFAARRLGAWYAAIAFVVIGLFSSVLLAQTPDSAKPPASLKNEAELHQQTRDDLPPGPTTGHVQYVGPDTYILLDSSGKPQPMPGMSYEDFMAAWRKLNQRKTSDNQPNYSIESIVFNGQVVGQNAELQCDATVQLLADGPIEVPLGLVGAILQGTPRFGAIPHADDSKSSADTMPKAKTELGRLTYDPEHGGFQATFSGHSGEKRRLSLQLIVPLLHDGAETSLPINCPRAVSSQLTVNIGAKISEARTNAGTLVSQDATPNGGTTLKVAGPAGLFRLSWQSVSKDSPAFTSVLNALGTIQVTIDGRGVRSDARLTVRSYGGTFDQFRVRLPIGAQLVRPDSSGVQDAKYHIRVEPDSTSSPKGNTDTRRQVVVVELLQKQQGPVVVDLATEQSGEPASRDQAINLGGFEVIGAVRQFGDIALSVANDWQARWEIGPFVRQVDPSELDPTLQTSNPTAAFQYDRQPWSLNVRVAPRQLRVQVTPKYDLECLPDEARLTVHLGYQVFGAPAFEFRVDLKGWKRTGDAIESGGLVDQDRVDVQKGILVLPLVQASSHRAEVSFSLRRATTRDPSRLQLPLPVPSADSVGTGELAVHAAPGLDLLPDLSNSTGISAAPVSQELNVSTSDGGTELHFRTLLPASVFVTDRVNRAREISTRSTTQIDIAQNTAQIEQRIEYTDRFEPVTELAFDVPYDVPSGSGGPDIVLLTATANTDSKIEEQGTPLHPNLPNDEPTTSSESETHEVRVMLPRPQIGTFVARIRYRYPMPKTTVADTRLAIPLIHPVDGDLTSNYFAIHAPRNLIINLDNDDESASWKPARSPTENNTPSTKLALVADSPELYLPLLIRSGRPDVPSSTIVDRVWLQTWLSNDTEQDRAAFRFRTAGSQITVELPYELPTDEIELLVDHQPAEVLSQAHGRLVVSLGPSAAGVVSEANSPVVAHTLELRSRHSYRHNVLTWHRLTPPQIEGSTALSQLYWQIVLPGDEHVIAPPAQLAPASQWQWLGTFWGRRPLKSQAELEEWVSASSQLAPADAQNQYLFTGLMPASTIELATGPRWMIVLVASAVVLGFSVACLYVPVGRRTWLLAAIALVIVVAAISFPAAALILAQASVIGFALAALGLILSRFVGRRGRIPTAPVVSPSSQRVVTPRADSFLLSPAIAASSTSPTTTLRSADSER